MRLFSSVAKLKSAFTNGGCTSVTVMLTRSCWVMVWKPGLAVVTLKRKCKVSLTATFGALKVVTSAEGVFSTTVGGSTAAASAASDAICCQATVMTESASPGSRVTLPVRVTTVGVAMLREFCASTPSTVVVAGLPATLTAAVTVGMRKVASLSSRRPSRLAAAALTPMRLAVSATPVGSVSVTPARCTVKSRGISLSLSSTGVKRNSWLVTAAALVTPVKTSGLAVVKSAALRPPPVTVHATCTLRGAGVKAGLPVESNCSGNTNGLPPSVCSWRSVGPVNPMLPVAPPSAMDSVTVAMLEPRGNCVPCRGSFNDDSTTSKPSAPSASASTSGIIMMVCEVSPGAKVTVPNGNAPPTKSAGLTSMSVNASALPRTVQLALICPAEASVKITV